MTMTTNRRVLVTIGAVIATLVAASLTTMTISGCRKAARVERRSSAAITNAGVAGSRRATPPRHEDHRLPRTDNELATTSAEIFFANLDGMIAGTARRVEQEPTSAAARRDLSNLLYGRAKHRGDLTELRRALVLMSEAITLDAKDGSAYLARANQLQTMHRFDEARKDLAQARRLFKAGGSGDETDVAALEAEIDYAQGRYEQAIPVIREAASTRRNASSVARLALLEHDLGNFDLADRLFSEAEGLIRDPNPIPVAWLNVQRGIHCQAAGQLDRAVVFFSEAARRIPHYVAAEEHLAETLHALGRDDEAIRLYEGIVTRSSDPEFRGTLAGLYLEHGRPEDAARLIMEATAEYSTLLATYPEAMYWHASEFFLREGNDPRRALDLLRKNAALRPSASSFVALARAYLANQRPREAKAAIDKALATPLRSADALWTAAEIESALAVGETTAADSLRSKARALNPRIGTDR